MAKDGDVAPDALCLADHPASIGNIRRDRERVFQQPARDEGEKMACRIQSLYSPRGASSPLTRIMHEPPAATADMAVLPGILGSSFDRLKTSSPCDVLSSTPQVRAPAVAGGTTISTISRRRLVHNAG
jgi:hypothetical protein